MNVRYFSPRKKGIKIPTGKSRVGLKIVRSEVQIPMYNILEIDTDIMVGAIMSLTGNVMRYNESGKFPVSNKFYNEKVLDKNLFREHEESIYFKV